MAVPEAAGSCVDPLFIEKIALILFVGFICGTDGDPQDYARQEATLRSAGIMLADSNAQAVRVAAAIARKQASS